MVQSFQVRQRWLGAGLLVAFVATLALGIGMALASPAVAGHNSAAGAAKGTTGGWLDGREVTFFYPKDFFCSQPPSSDAASGCEVGAEPERAPRPGGGLPVLYVMTPFGINVDAGTLQCPTSGECINHPGDLDVSRLLGPGAVIPLPPHSHIVDVAKGGWWEIEVILVTDEEVWNEIAQAKDLATVRALQDAGVGITGDIPTNLFLFFNVQN
ncbi:MAG TPA: hypothetical protein VM305_04750 [Candidatus Limnocylindrales bacterium]|nr:hypothetical protein [Candidatus Limnocylindrales bacterium]